MARPGWRRAVWAGSGLLLVCGLLAGTMAWMLRPEALRQRVEAALVEALARPVTVQAANWHWQPAPAGGEAQILVRVQGIEVPSVTVAAEPTAGRVGAGAQPVRRGASVEQIALFLRAAPRDWWRAWRGELPWPVTALQASGVVSLAPEVNVLAGDGLGSWRLTQLDLAGIVAAASAPRVLRVKAQGAWQRERSLPWVPVTADLRDVAATPGFGSGFSLDQAQLQLGVLQMGLARVVVGTDSASFAVKMPDVNLREALPPLGIPVPPTTDPAVFARVALQAECHVDFDLVNLGAGCDSVVLQVDGSTFTGQAWRAPRGMPEAGVPHGAGGPGAPWQLRLTGDRLNLDRYLPPDNLQEPPTPVPWNLVDAWPVRLDLAVQDLRMAGLRFRNAKLVLRAGEHGLVRE